jgi:Helicase associated domain
VLLRGSEFFAFARRLPEVKNKMKQFHTKKWDEMFDRLRAYMEIHGDCLVPKRYPPDQKLATWVHTQRIQYKKSFTPSAHSSAQDGNAESATLTKKEDSKDDDTFDPLSDERRHRLDEIGFCWSARVVDRPAEARSKPTPRNSYDDQWDAMFERSVSRRSNNPLCD